MNHREPAPIDGCFFRPLAAPLASATWEITNRCSLHCVHCCTEAGVSGLPDELSTAEARAGLDYLFQRWSVREIYFSGGEPFERQDFLSICQHAANLGMRLSVASAGLPVTREVARAVAKLPFDFVHVSLDSAEEKEHDQFRGFRGSHRAALSAIDHLVAAGVEVRVGTVVSRLNWRGLAAIAELCVEHGVKRLNLTLMLDAGRARRTHGLGLLLAAQEREQAQKNIEELAAALAGRLEVDRRRTKTTTTEPLGECPGATRLFHIDARGIIWPCSWIAKLLPQFRLGHLRASEPIPTENRQRYLAFLEARRDWSGCRGCSLSAGCGRGCPIAAHLYSGEALQRDPICQQPMAVGVKQDLA